MEIPKWNTRVLSEVRQKVKVTCFQTTAICTKKGRLCPPNTSKVAATTTFKTKAQPIQQ